MVLGDDPLRVWTVRGSASQPGADGTARSSPSQLPHSNLEPGFHTSSAGTNRDSASASFHPGHWQNAADGYQHQLGSGSIVQREQRTSSGQAFHECEELACPLVPVFFHPCLKQRPPPVSASQCRISQGTLRSSVEEGAGQRESGAFTVRRQVVRLLAPPWLLLENMSLARHSGHSLPPETHPNT